jgi:hypothetical protein
LPIRVLVWGRILAVVRTGRARIKAAKEWANILDFLRGEIATEDVWMVELGFFRLGN